jgi:hypothetical protein
MYDVAASLRELRDTSLPPCLPYGLLLMSSVASMVVSHTFLVQLGILHGVQPGSAVCLESLVHFAVHAVN